MSFILFVSACSADAKIEDVSKEWEPSPVFISENRDMIGIEGKIGLQDGSHIVAGEPSKQMWHFWGDDLLNKYLSAKAYHEETNDEEINPLVRGEEYSVSPGVNGADYSLPSHLQFPEPGVWKMDVYINEEYYESIFVEVNE